MDFMTREELDQILTAARKYSDILYTFMALMAYAGLRPSEALQLRVKDIYIMGRVVKEITLPGTNTKTRTGRDVPIPQPLTEALERYLIRNETFEDPSAYLFPNKQSTHLTLRNMQYAVRKIGYAILHRHVTPKTFRHTYATLLARKAPLRSVQQALGHASITSTQVYTHPAKDDLKHAIDTVFIANIHPFNVDQPLPLNQAKKKE